ncbi:MAG: hypothetical protein CMG93_09730 [Marinomonas sp.]|nr:hypothetical protein [Marinomonas sp.]
MNNKNIVVPLHELETLEFEIKDICINESNFRFLEYPADPHLDDDLETEVFVEFRATGTAEFITKFNGNKLIAKYRWLSIDDKINDGEYKDLDITDESYTLIDCNFSIYDEEYGEIEDVRDNTLQTTAAGFEDATSDVVGLIEYAHSKFFK